jgi:hypothetical protein
MGDLIGDAGWYPDPEGRAVRRYFDGEQWTAHWERLDEYRRQQILQQTLVEHTSAYVKVVAQSATSAKLVRVDPGENNAVHAILTLLTCGAWLFIWLLVIAMNQRNTVPTRTVTVDEYGAVHWT